MVTLIFVIIDTMPVIDLIVYPDFDFLFYLELGVWGKPSRLLLFWLLCLERMLNMGTISWTRRIM